ncbi:aminodeoxychorismate synthase [Malassezia sp. CBS 17886]|nr:aminodeoxychorismate synthase [Malassezia sp. CBS 17886]
MREKPQYLDDRPFATIPAPWKAPAHADDSDVSTTSTELHEQEQDQLARQEWEEGMRQLQFAFQLVLIPFFGKWLGRRWSYWDHYDSYTRNLLSLLHACTDSVDGDRILRERVVVIPHTHKALAPENVHTQLLPHLDAIILSPGPGRPDKDADFGSSTQLLARHDLVQLPVLGICLGHQGIATTAGARTAPLSQPFHGRKRRLFLDTTPVQRAEGERGILEGVPDGTEVICYNSLAVVEESLPPNIRVVARSPLDVGGVRGAHLVQAIEHTSLPYYGVQFHPESVESAGGVVVLRNFLANVDTYWRAREPGRVDAWRRAALRLPPELQALGDSCVSHSTDAPEPPAGTRWRIVQHSVPMPSTSRSVAEVLSEDAPRIVQRAFRRARHSGPLAGCVWLDSASALDPQSQATMMATADFSLTYDMCARLSVQAQKRDASMDDAELPKPGSLWGWMSTLQQNMQRLTQDDSSLRSDACLFRTGFAGYWGYEMKDESLELHPLDARRYQTASPTDAVDPIAVPAAQWGFCSRVLVFDHASVSWTCFALVRSEEWSARAAGGPLGELDAALAALGVSPLGVSQAEADEWFAAVGSVVADVLTGPRAVSTAAPAQPLPPLNPVDDADVYQEKIRAAQDLIAAGESYELCLTTQFQGRVRALEAHNYDPLFDLYCGLRRRNPAPFAAYLELAPVGGKTPLAILSTSPERFLTVTREGSVEMRPIKGTLVRPGFGKGEEEWQTRAAEDPEARTRLEEEDKRRRESLAADPKEHAENLMIADLIRADLQSVCFPGSVQVPRLIALETYQTVHQLVTSVTGQLRPGIGCVEATRRCFPPGSMTGAPKRRSVELLEKLERTPGHDASRRRGAYSGALGFIGVDGAANMSVVIRTVTAQGDGVAVGAGGAVTFLSTPAGEWDEVLTKLGSLTTMAT